MSNERIAETQSNFSTILASNAIDWVSPVNSPRVLVVPDDNNQGEYEEDAAFVHINLLQAGYRAELIDEPLDGLSPDDLDQVDVVWFSNPGHHIDDEITIDSLLKFVERGGGLVLQGDDMSWREEATPLTHLEHVNNGTRYCGQKTDNNLSANYYVDVVNQPHPVIAGLEGITFRYGDDIDTSIPIQEGEVVLAWTSKVDICNNVCDPKPVIIALDWEQDKD